MKLLIQGLTKYLVGLVIVGLLLFLPAQSFSYWNAWLFIALLFIPMFVVGIILFLKNKELLERRLNAKEKENEQKLVILISLIMFISGFVVAGLNFKYQWIVIPNIVVILSSIVFFLSYMVYMEVLRENTYLSRTIEVKEDQKVMDTGLYGVIRHPMYFSTIFLFLSIPLILGSIQSFFIFLIHPILMIVRINNEEKVLEKELKGYKEYKKKVKYRLIPFIW